METSTIIQNQREARAAQVANDLASASPFVDPNQALAAAVDEIKNQSLEYARLNSEQAREQFETMARNDLRRKQSAEQTRNEDAQRFGNLMQARDERDDTALTGMFRQLAATEVPGENARTMPLERLRTISDTVDKAQRFLSADQIDALNQKLDPYLHPLDQTQSLAQQLPEAQQVRQNRPETFPDGSTVQVQQHEDGSLEAHLITGEVFRGSPLEITQKLSEAQVSTKRWGQAQRAAAHQQPGTQAQPDPQAASENPAPQFGSLSEAWAAQQADLLAKRFGFSGEAEMVSHFANLSQQAEHIQDMERASTFLQSCPDFPNTEEASNALAAIVTQNGWDFSAQNMEAAHHLAVKHGVYQPLPPEAVNATWEQNLRASNRPVAPPMISSKSPDGNQTGYNPWDTKQVPLADLRAAAIRQQLEGK
jgi:hypothetical protein